MEKDSLSDSQISVKYDIQEVYKHNTNTVIDYRYFFEINKALKVTEEEYRLILFSFLILDCSKKFSKKCAIMRKNLFHTYEIANQKQKSMNNCVKQKRKGICVVRPKYFYLNTSTNKCVQLHKLIEKVEYSKVSNKYRPVQCVSNHFLDPITSKCNHHILHYLEMNKAERCIACSVGYSVSFDKKLCVKCSANCTNCADPHTCIACVSGHFLFSNKGNIALTLEVNQTICKPFVYPCLECLSESFCKVCDKGYQRFSKNVTTKICKIVCDPEEYVKNNKCEKCDNCDFCQIRGKPVCTNCDKCRSICEFKISEEFRISSVTSSYFYVETPGFILHDTDTISKASEKLSVNKISSSKYKITHNGLIREEEFIIFFEPFSVSSKSCFFRIENPLKLVFTKTSQNVVGLTPENLVSAVTAFQFSMLIAQFKSNYFYYLIEIVNLNKAANYFFIFDHMTKNILKDYNNFSRSNNYVDSNFVQKYFYNLTEFEVIKKFKLVSITCSFAMRENLVQEQDVIGINEIILFIFMLLLTLNYYCVFTFFKCVMQYHQMIIKNPYKTKMYMKYIFVILRLQKRCTLVQRKVINIINKSRVALLFSKFLFLNMNEKYFILFLSLLSMYSLSISHIFVKLTLIVTRFPDSRFTPKTIFLMIYYSVTLMFGYFVVINKLMNDFPKYEKMTILYQKIMKRYTILKRNYFEKIKELQCEDTTQTKEDKKIRIHKIKAIESNDFKSLRVPFLDEGKKIKKLLKKIKKIQVRQLTTSVFSIIKIFCFVLIILFF